jgi:hypothetical protein
MSSGGKQIFKDELTITRDKSATTSRAGGMRKAPRRGRGYALLVVADLGKEFWLHVTFS